MAAVDFHGVGIEGADAGAQLLQNFQNGGNVGNLGDIFDAADAVYQNGGGDNGDGGVFRTADFYLTEEGLAAVYNIFCQRSDLISGILLRGREPCTGTNLPAGPTLHTPREKSGHSRFIMFAVSIAYPA